MAWTTYTAVNFRNTLAFAADNAGEVALVHTGADGTLPVYTPGVGSNSPLTVNGNTFNIGWLTSSDGTRDRSVNIPSSSDHRLAGCHFTNASRTLQMQFGNAPGTYRIWAGISDQSSGTANLQFALSDANGAIAGGTQTALTGLSGQPAKVYDILGNLYATGAAWAAASGGAGNYLQFTTTDTSNGNGGPLLRLVCADGTNATPIAHIAIQFLPPNSATPIIITSRQTIITDSQVFY